MLTSLHCRCHSYETKCSLITEPNMCDDIEAPGNGTVKPDNSVYEYQDYVEFCCDDGYMLKGDVNATCQANQTWDHEIPSCGK